MAISSSTSTGTCTKCTSANQVKSGYQFQQSAWNTGHKLHAQWSVRRFQVRNLLVTTYEERMICSRPVLGRRTTAHKWSWRSLESTAYTAGVCKLDGIFLCVSPWNRLNLQTLHHYPHLVLSGRSPSIQDWDNHCILHQCHSRTRQVFSMDLSHTYAVYGKQRHIWCHCQ